MIYILEGEVEFYKERVFYEREYLLFSTDLLHLLLLNDVSLV